MDVLMPQLGETVAEGKVGEWFKQVGDQIAAGDNLFAVETDKVTMEVQALGGGVLTDILVAAGETVSVGTLVAVIGDGAGAKPKAAAKTKPAQQAEAAPKPAPAPAALAKPLPRSQAASDGSYPAYQVQPFAETRTPEGRYGSVKDAGLGDLRVTPLARRLIAQNGLAASMVAAQVRANGGSRIGRREVMTALASAPAAGAVAAPKPLKLVAREGDEIVALNKIQKRGAERLAEAWRTAPHVAQGIDVDFSAIAAIRAKRKDAFKKAHGVSLSFLPFIARAVCIGLRDFPKINARFDGEKLYQSRDVHLGIAVDLGHDGLVVPVVHNAGDLTVTGLAKAIGRQVEKARAGTLQAEDMEGGTYTITNNGAFGTRFTAPIINLPQVAILSTDAIEKRAVVVVDGKKGEEIAIRTMGTLVQSFDHRAMDGAYAGAFLNRLKAILATEIKTNEIA